MTFTVLARHPQSGLLGAATASRSLAVGNAVPAVRAGVGAVASQAWTNRALRGLLLDATDAGADAQTAIDRIADWDSGAPLRQALLLPARGAGAAHTGTETTPWTGHLVLEDAIVAGNLLAGPGVLEAMRDALAPLSTLDAHAPDAAARFAGVLVGVLAAGEVAGGDVRGRQSAAVLVAGATEADGTVDLRVDDHADPLEDLARLVDLRAADLRGTVTAR